MPIVPVADWTPDQAAIANQGSLSIVNAVPGATGYKPFKALVPFTNALASRPRGAISVRDKDNNVYNYVGTATSLRVQSSSAWNDVSIGGGYATVDPEVWEFAQWKNKLLATNFINNPQQITLGAANFSNLTAALKGRHIAVVRDFVVFGNTFDAVDGNKPNRLRWSAFNDETDYTVSPSTGSDFRDLQSGGGIQKVIGGQYGVVVSERSTFRQSFAGAPKYFDVDETLPGIGTLAAGSVVGLGDRVWFWAEQGIAQVTNATGAEWPAAGKFDEFLKKDVDSAYLHRISAVVDPRSGRVLWAYPGSGNLGGRPNKLLIFDTNFGKGAIITEDVELIWRAAAVGISLDDIVGSIDDVEGSLDSSVFVGGQPNLAAFDETFAHGFFNGNNMTAVIETRESEINPGRFTQLNAFRALVDGGTITARVATRKRLSDQPTYGPMKGQRASGRIPARGKGRYHRVELTISGDDWKDAVGIEYDREDAIAVGARG